MAQAAPAVADAATGPISVDSRPPAESWAKDYRVWAVSGFLVVAVGLVFGQNLGHEFIDFDDGDFIFRNPNVTPGLTLSGLRWALTSGPLLEWCPVTTLSHMLDCQLYGARNPAGHFLTNLLLHAAASVLLFLALLRMTDQRAVPEVAQVSGGRVASAGPSAATLWPSAWVAAIFAIHPLHVESVAWLAERRDVMSGLFFMLVLLTYARYAERPSLARYLPVFVCLALGLMSKPMLVTVPCLLLLLDYWPLRRFAGPPRPSPGLSRQWLGRLPIGWRLLIEKIPLAVLSAVSCQITMSGHGLLPEAGAVDRLPLLTRLENAAVACVAYLGQTFYPVDMAIVYPNLGAPLPVTWVVGSVVLLVAITLVAIFSWRTRPYLIVGWLWFLGMLVPVLGLVGQFTHSRADRYTYLTQIGLTIALAWAVWGVYQLRQAIAPARWREQTLALVAGAAVLVLGAVAWRQDSFWRDAETLWTHAIACTEQNAMARYCLAVNYVNDDKIDQAIPQLEEALAAGSIKRTLIGKTHVLLGECFALQGRFDEAITQYEEMVRLFPAVEMGHVSLAMTLASAGRHDRAIAQWNEAIRLNPTFWAARVGLAESLLAAGDPAEAARQCRQVLEEQPGAIKALVLLGEALADQGQTDEAIRQFGRAVELTPQNVTAQYRLGLLEYEAGQAESALSHLNQAIKLEPDNAKLLGQTAWILATCPEESIRDGDRSVELAQKAIKLGSSQDPRDFDVLAAAFAEKGDFAAAVKTARQASTLALTQNKLELSAEITARMRLYRDGQPFREPAAKPRSTSATPAERKSATDERQPES